LQQQQKSLKNDVMSFFCHREDSSIMHAYPIHSSFSHKPTSHNTRSSTQMLFLRRRRLSTKIVIIIIAKTTTTNNKDDGAQKTCTLTFSHLESNRLMIPSVCNDSLK